MTRAAKIELAAALALFLGIVVSGNLQENPVMIATIVLFWAVIAWVVLRVVRLIATAARSESGGA